MLPTTPIKTLRLPAARRLTLAALAAAGTLVLASTPGATRGQPATGPNQAGPGAAKAGVSNAGAAVTPSAFAGIAESELTDAGQGLAQRFSAAAFELLQTGDNDKDKAAWRQAAAFLEAAGVLDPTEPYYPRMRSMALEQAGEPELAVEALVAYLRLNFEDEVAKLKLIEYDASRQQSNAARIDYLKGLLEKPSISDEIKSRCATWLASALAERSAAESAEMVARAVKLDPVNVYARRMEYQLVAAAGTPVERVRSLLAQLRCNPAQVTVLGSLGRELAAAGMVRESARWFNAAAGLSIRGNIPVDSGFFVEYAAQLFLNGELQLADEVTGKVVETDKTNMDGWFLRLTLRQAAGQRVAFEQDLEQAKRLLVARAGVLAGKILDDQPAGAVAATRPAGDAAAGGASTKPFDFAGAFSTGGGAGTSGRDAPGGRGGGAAPVAAAPTAEILAKVVARLAQPDAPAFFKQEFISAVSDLAWYELYYNRSETAAATWVGVATQLLGPDDVTVRRLRGWLELLRSQDGKAMQTLWPIRKTDALAGLGVVELLSRGPWAVVATRPAGAAPATKPADYDPDLLAQDLLDRSPSGLVGSILAGAFKGRKVFARPGPAAEAMREELKTFPIDLISVVDQPDRFYIPVGEETKKPYRLGEPVMVKVRLQNNSNYDLPIGPDGVIKPDLWFDGRISLTRDRLFPMCGTDKVANGLVLKAKSSITQVVRVDQGTLAVALRERPAGSVNLYMTVMTNPLVQFGPPDAANPSGMRVVAGPGGVRRQFNNTLIRGGLPINNEADRKKLLDLTAGLPTQKYWAIDTMAAFVRQARGPDTDRKSEALQPEFVEQIGRSQSDRVPLVGAWATITSLRLMTDPAQANGKVALVDPLASSPAWEVRLAGVLAARELDAAAARRVAARLKGDVNPIVRAAAEAEDVLAPKRVAPDAATPPAPAAGRPAGPTGPSSPAGPALPPPGAAVPPSPAGPPLPPTAGPALPPGP
jgi:tetratricopeptide (TPR) repeat protein